jgi:hypothetical protein
MEEHRVSLNKIENMGRRYPIIACPGCQYPVRVDEARQLASKRCITCGRYPVCSEWPERHSKQCECK